MDRLKRFIATMVLCLTALFASMDGARFFAFEEIAGE
jgi:hypothetical protein